MNTPNDNRARLIGEALGYVAVILFWGGCIFLASLFWHFGQNLMGRIG